MCDLIDLNSPDRKDLLNSRLASPLIPIPTDTVCNNYNTRTNEPSSLIAGKRDSLENNPFDMVLQKTTEYIQKKDDPFEMTLEKALKLKCKKNTLLRSYSFDLPDYSVLKQQIHRQKSKMNQTLDESLINDELNKNNSTVNKISNENKIVELNNTNLLSNDLKSDNVVPTINVEDIDLSILNQSVMNDTLFETDQESNDNQMKCTLQVEKNKINIEQISFPNATLNIPKLRRSFSEGKAVSPKKSQYLNQISLVESLRNSSNGSSNNPSPNSLDILNEGFLKSCSSGNSVFSSLSNISSIPKSYSVSSTINSSMMLSDGTMNRTFLESCSSEKSENTKLNENMDINKEIKSILPAIKNSTSVANATTKTSISDLTDRFNKLKARVSEVHIPKTSNDTKEGVTITEKNEKLDINNKLIDIDVFIPDNNCSKSSCRNSISDASSDSVFFEGNKVNNSIFHEAKLLARTFEELALKTSSGSSIDDLITNNPSWTLELLPAFDDETSVENLIELPASPDGTDMKLKNVNVVEHKNNNSYTNKKDEFSNEVEKNIKDLEMELVEPVSTEKRLRAVTLLLDLKKLVKTENNIEANKLLENLEKALGVNCENNTELLATYLNATNDLAKSPQKSSSSLEIIKNVSANNMEHSQEDNLSGNSTESIKESVFFENINFNDVNTSKCMDNQKYLNNVNSKSKSKISETEISTEKIKKEKTENELNAQKAFKEDSLCKQESTSLLNEKVVIELLTNIGKLLCGQTEEHPSLNILKNLGKVLNSASSNHDVDEDTKVDYAHVKIQQTPKKSKLKFENKTHSSLLSKSANRLSLNLESKKQPVGKNCIRRSVSISHTPPIKNESGLSMSTRKNTSQLKEVTKRFPSDPGFISPTLNKKVITNNMKNELQKDIPIKTVTTSNLQKAKSSTIYTVKNKLKKKISTDIINKKGPMKAVHPIGTMQKIETVNKKITSSIESITPPRSHKIISSTPNSTNNGHPVKRSRSSKPVASSTPDAQNSKMQKVQSQVTNSPKRRNFSCDISPVTARTNVSNNNGMNNSPRRSNKLPSPKKTTPKRRPLESGIPKSKTPPVNKRLNSSFDVNQYERLYESPQRSLYKKSNSQKNSPVSLKKNENNPQQSPLKESNKLIYKVKPINLISKLRRHSIGTNVMEKENYV